LARQQVELGPLGDEEVEVQVEHCGLCHSDLSMQNNDWGFSQFPAVLGHEAVGRVVEVGRAAKGLKVGQRVGIGWTAGSCMHCRQCLSGNHHLCPESTFIIVGHKGAFASRVRAHWAWAIPLPEAISVPEAGVPGRVGGVGDPVVSALRRRDLPVRALVCSKDDKADAVRAIGAEVVVGDLTRAADVLRALAGCKRMYFGMSVSASYLEATVTTAAAAREHADLEVFVNISPPLELAGPPPPRRGCVRYLPGIGPTPPWPVTRRCSFANAVRKPEPASRKPP
jgi:uncharacterized zinc-type alcohol dehydrogenase-like protein